MENNMKIVFTTSLDMYQKRCYPENLTQVPRKGDFIAVNEDFISYYIDKNFPQD